MKETNELFFSFFGFILSLALMVMMISVYCNLEDIKKDIYQVKSEVAAKRFNRCQN